jgi:hypothetical protein
MTNTHSNILVIVICTLILIFKIYKYYKGNKGAEEKEKLISSSLFPFFLMIFSILKLIKIFFFND